MTRSRNSSSCRRSSPSGQTKIRRTPASTKAASRSTHSFAGPINNGAERSASTGRCSIGASTLLSARSAAPLSSVTYSQVVAIATGNDSGVLPTCPSSSASRAIPSRTLSGVCDRHASPTPAAPS